MSKVTDKKQKVIFVIDIHMVTSMGLLMVFSAAPSPPLGYSLKIKWQRNPPPIYCLNKEYLQLTEKSYFDVRTSTTFRFITPSGRETRSFEFDDVMWPFEISGMIFLIDCSKNYILDSENLARKNEALRLLRSFNKKKVVIGVNHEDMNLNEEQLYGILGLGSEIPFMKSPVLYRGEYPNWRFPFSFVQEVVGELNVM